MKKKITGLTIGFLMFGMVGMVNATLIGDTVYSQHNAPLGGFFAPEVSTIVTADATDQMFHYPHYYLVNVGSSEIVVTFTEVALFSDFYDFNGLVVRDLNDSSGNVLTGISASSSLSGYNTSWITFSDDRVYFEWGGVYITSGTTFRVDLQFGGTSSPVPEPSTMLLLGFGLVGLAGAGRKKMKK